MSLFVVQHKHAADACPARDEAMAPKLLEHLSAQNARQFGISILSEAVIDGGHTLYLTVEAASADKVKSYMEPFARVGTVEVLAASRCEVVVERGVC